MRKFIISVIISLGLIVLSDGLWAQDSSEEGFVSLFNGKDLSGWVSVGTPSFTVRENAIYATGAKPHPSWLRTEKEYENFILRFSYKTTRFYEGGILIHAPQDGPGERIGFKIHIRHDQHALGSRSPGAIYDVAAPDTIANHLPNQWNRCEVLCDWPVLRVTMNGVVIHDIDMSKNEILKYRMRRGYIGIQNIGGSRTYFKDIEIKTLPDKEKQWVSLFDGGIEGFQLQGNSDWAILKNVLTARGSSSMAYTKKDFYGPFEMQVWVKSMVDGNGGIVFSDNNKKNRVEIQCFNVEGSTNPTGSIYGIAPASRVVSRDMEWYLMQIFSDGHNVKVFVNGEKVAETNDLKEPLGGRIGFQQHTPNGYIQYRGARIKKL